MDEIDRLIANCDLLLVIGASAQVYPAAGLPRTVKENNGLIYEFNMEHTSLSTEMISGRVLTDYFFQGDACVTLPRFGGVVSGS